MRKKKEYKNNSTSKKYGTTDSGWGKHWAMQQSIKIKHWWCVICMGIMMMWEKDCCDSLNVTMLCMNNALKQWNDIIYWGFLMFWWITECFGGLSNVFSRDEMEINVNKNFFDVIWDKIVELDCLCIFLMKNRGWKAKRGAKGELDQKSF